MKLVFIGINDVHSWIEYKETISKNNKKQIHAGFAYLKTYLNLLKKQYGESNVIVFSQGDNVEGYPISDIFLGEPISKLFKAIGIKYSAVGNHDFSYGVDQLIKLANDGGYTYLANNIFDKKTNKLVSWSKPYTIENYNGIKIGLIGSTTLFCKTQSSPLEIEPFEFTDFISSIRESISEIENEVDLIIVVSHLTSLYDDINKKIIGEAADLANAKLSDKLSFIFSGHTHQLVNDKIQNQTILQALSYNLAISMIILEFDNNKKLISSESYVNYLENLITKFDLKQDEEILNILQYYDKKAQPILNEKLAFAENAINNKVTGELLSPASELIVDLLLGVKIDYRIDFSVLNGGAIRGSFKKGEITTANLLEVAPTIDKLVIFQDLTGAEIYEIANYSNYFQKMNGLELLSSYSTVKISDNFTQKPLIGSITTHDDLSIGERFIFGGLKIEYSLEKKTTVKITKIDGTEVLNDNSQKFNLITTSYMAFNSIYPQSKFENKTILEVNLSEGLKESLKKLKVISGYIEDDKRVYPESDINKI